MFLKKWAHDFLSYFSDEEDPDDPVYDPRHIAVLIVAVLVAMTVLFWLLWALLVFGGGIQAKVLPFLQVAFTAKTVADFGYIGSPYAMGVFKGWVTNLVALLFSVALLSLLWHVFTIKKREGNKE